MVIYVVYSFGYMYCYATVTATVPITVISATYTNCPAGDSDDRGIDRGDLQLWGERYAE